MRRSPEEINFWIIWIILLIFLALILITNCNSQEIKLPPFNPNPINIPKISEDIKPVATVKRDGHVTYLFTIFFPEFLYVKEDQLSIQDAINFWDRVASQDACNGTRVFIVHSPWNNQFKSWVEVPFEKDNNGKYVLPELDESIEDYINPEWKRLLLTRLKILRDREIFRSIGLWDFCQMHYQNNSAWDTHWLKQIDGDPQQAFNIYSKSFKYVEKFTRYVVNLIWTEETKYKRPGWNT